MNNCDEDKSIHNELLQLEIVIDRPVAQVWRRYLDIGSWVTSHTIEYVFGSPGTLGSIFRPSFKRAKELGMPLPHHHYCKVIKVIPEQQYVLKSYSEKGGSYGYERMTGFDIARFLDMNGKTKLTFDFYGENKGDVAPKDPAAPNHDEDDHMWKNLQNLQRIVESQPRSQE